ncbi:MAG: glycosyltransferase [Phycisphaera sp.]|nr:glycosyltransferase [Phycisphaera sp.]
MESLRETTTLSEGLLRRTSVHRPRILHVIPWLGPGGAERALLDIVRTTGKQFDPMISVLSDRNTFPGRIVCEREPLLLDCNIAIGSVRRTCHAVSRLRQVVREFQPKIIHTHLWEADVIGGLAVVGSDVRHVSHQQGTSPWVVSTRVRSAGRRVLTRLVFRATRPRFIAVSQAVANYISQGFHLDQHDFRVVHNAVDTEVFSPSNQTADSNSIRIGCAGRLVPEKGFNLLVEAIGIVVAMGIDCELHIAGDGRLRGMLAQAAADANVSERVHFVGLLDDMRPFYSSLDFFVQPSLTSEGFSLAIIEAMSMGLPVIATAVGGASEAIIEGSTGIVVPPADAKALAEAVRVLASAPEMRRSYGLQARERAIANYDVRNIGGQVMAIYDEVLCSV